MMRLSRCFRLGIAVLLVAPILTAGPKPQEQQTTPVINFVAGIDNQSISILMSIVNAQMKSGAKRIKILISSSGGDTASAFAAYNFLHNLPIQIVTYNEGTVDSAAVLLFCGGHERYSLRGTRFLIHGNSLTVPAGMPMNAETLNSQLLQLKSLNGIIVQVVSAATKDAMRSRIESAVNDQIILTADDARDWGLVKEVRDNYYEAGDMMVELPIPAPDTKIAPPNPTTTPYAPTAKK